MVTSWPLTSRTALKWKKLTQFFYHEWLLDVVVEDWDIRPILLMHFLKWICKWISFQSYWVLSDTLQQSMFDFIRRIFCCGRKNNHWQQDMFTIPCPEEVVISTKWPRTTVALLQHKPMRDRSCSRKKTELTCPKSLTNSLRMAPRRTKSVADSQLHAKKVKERRSWR